MAEDDTLAGYHAVHGRAPAFEGVDGRAYSVGVFSDDDPAPDGRYGKWFGMATVALCMGWLLGAAIHNRLHPKHPTPSGKS